MTIPNESRNQNELANKSERSLVFRYQPFVSRLRHKTRDTQNKNWAAFLLTEGVSKGAIWTWKTTELGGRRHGGIVREPQRRYANSITYHISLLSPICPLQRGRICGVEGLDRVALDGLKKRLTYANVQTYRTCGCRDNPHQPMAPRRQGLRVPSLRSTLVQSTLVRE